MTRRLPRTDRTRAALLLWGGWLLVTGAVLSFASGIIHTYYAVELAPAIAALVAIGAVTLWRRRDESGARLALTAGVLVTGLWSYALLHRATGWHPVGRGAGRCSHLSSRSSRWLCRRSASPARRRGGDRPKR